MAECIPQTGGNEQNMMSVFHTGNVIRSSTRSVMKENTGLNDLRGSEHDFLT